MKDPKLPAFQFYPGDWRKDLGVQSLSFHDRGVWLEMLLLMHSSERRGVLVLNGNAMTDDMIARSIGLDNQTFNQTLTNLLTSGVASREPGTGAILNRRMVRDEEIRKIRAEVGKKGGNPILLKRNSTTGVKQVPTPSSSSSSSDKPRRQPSDFALPSWIPESTWEDFEESRNKLRKPMTDRAKRDIVAKLDHLRANGQDVEAVLAQSIRKGWQDVFEVKDDLFVVKPKLDPLAGMNFVNGATE